MPQEAAVIEVENTEVGDEDNVAAVVDVGVA